ncbi:stage IV sporulation protein [Bacillus coahuilensis m2-6]|uniref:sporulation protein YqfD n=2 Tax=Bacillus coahuilensis TaxID=408580 RepID=UPI000791B5B1|nr:sporulation protein YqfD [Bacillus coahuilensis]KUP07234.1 stage IV sporulation protein [Bacillus coahuilensis m2-6]
MKNHWITRIQGTIFVKVQGKGVERFINNLVRHNIFIWNVKRVGTETLTFYISVHDLHNLRRASRRTECHVTFVKGQGLPFYAKRFMLNLGFAIGTFLFFLMLILLSNMTWRIDVAGASPETEHQIKQTLEEIGVRKGKFQFLTPTPEIIQKELSYQLENITWIGVELQGTSYQLQVVEKNEPEETESVSPQHLVAKKSGTIVKQFVEEGKSIVGVNQFVKKGDMLVSGLIGKEDEYSAVSARGVVFAETWYDTIVEVPLTTEFTVLTGEENRRFGLSFGEFTIPIWGFWLEKFSSSYIDTFSKPLYIWKWQLPLSIKESTEVQTEVGTRTYKKDEAVDRAIEIGEETILSKLPKEAEIKNYKIRQQKVESGKVNVTIIFQVIENIAEAQPIVQGDKNDRTD